MMMPTMTGLQLKQWRISAGLSGREVADDILRGQVTQPTVSRWEASPNPIPQWVADAVLSTTKITLSLHELHTLLDYCRATGQNFNQLLAAAVREYLAHQRATAPNIAQLPTAVDTVRDAVQLVAETMVPYAAPETRQTS